jgi:programmed cell death 6-interacting protein
MLAIALKTADHADLKKVLSQYVARSFGTSDQVQPLLQTVNQLRLDALTLDKTPDVRRQALCGYLGALALLESRLPFGPGPDQVCVHFTWFDSFRPQSKVSFNALSSERACVVFNLAALYSVLGRDSDRSTTEGQKQAIQHFTKAAGVFCLLREQLLSGSYVVSVDMQDGTLQLCTSLMLAQAQAVFYEKGVKDKLARGLLSKLACQAASYFKTAADYAQRLEGKLDPSWRAHCQFQELAFLAAAHYQQHLLDKPEVEAKLQGFGLLITRLKLASELCAQALDLARLHHLTITEAVGPLKQVVDAELHLLEKDNNTVYFETVPPRSELTQLQMVPAVKMAPVTLKELVDGSLVEPFRPVLEGLVPQDVTQKCQEFKQRAETLLGELEAVLRKREAEVGASLQARGLPLALDSHASDSALLPEPLWEKVQSLQLAGGLEAVTASLDVLEQMQQSAGGKLTELRQKLEAEAQDDLQARSAHGPRFVRLPSPQANVSLHQQINQYSVKLQSATTTNQQLRVRLEQVKGRDLLSKTREELEALASGAAKGPQALGEDSVKDQCRQALAQLDTALAEVRKDVDGFRGECRAQ